MKEISGILLFDGFCVLCSYFVRKLVNRFGDSLELIPVQSEKGASVLKANGLPTEMPDEVILITDSKIFSGVKAIIYLMRNGGGWWRIAGAMLEWLPIKVSDWFYAAVARNRYVWFGKRNTCYLG
jgi:predicted DCC family thiol-disulfide oxidoreductase YuxK